MRKLVYRSALGNSLPKTMDEYSRHDSKVKNVFFEVDRSRKKKLVYMSMVPISRGILATST